jgi:hypothetical protein|tara:strand:+ start:1210 stop:1374 length:165 start_codon:yes stop_codon:yes gene_type:complete
MVVDNGGMDILVRLVLQHLDLDIIARFDRAHHCNVDLSSVWQSKIFCNAIKIDT